MIHDAVKTLCNIIEEKYGYHATIFTPDVEINDDGFDFFIEIYCTKKENQKNNVDAIYDAIIEVEDRCGLAIQPIIHKFNSVQKYYKKYLEACELQKTLELCKAVEFEMATVNIPICGITVKNGTMRRICTSFSNAICNYLYIHQATVPDMPTVKITQQSVLNEEEHCKRRDSRNNNDYLESLREAA